MKVLNIIKSYFLQLILSIVAYLSWIQTIEIANQHYLGTTFRNRRERNYENIATDVTSGLEGGALAMGLICCVCIVMVVWIENSKKSKP
jgi:hypothetical protein